MGNIKPKELSKLGYTDNMARSIAIETVHKHCKHYSQEQIADILRQVIQTPEAYKAYAKSLKVFIPLFHTAHPMMYVATQDGRLSNPNLLEIAPKLTY